MAVNVYHFRRGDNIVLSVFADETADVEEIKKDIRRRHGNVEEVESERNIVPDWSDIQNGFKHGNFKKIGK